MLLPSSLLAVIIHYERVCCNHPLALSSTAQKNLLHGKNDKLIMDFDWNHLIFMYHPSKIGNLLWYGQFHNLWTKIWAHFNTLACLYQLQIQFHRARKWAAIKLYVNRPTNRHQVELLCKRKHGNVRCSDKLDYGK